MSFQTDIEAITGSISSYTTEADSYLTEGVKFIVKYIMNNEEVEPRLTTTTNLNDSGNTLPLGNVMKV